MNLGEMENIHIFSGDIPTIVCTYFNKIYLNNNYMGDVKSNESNKSQQSSIKPGSIAIFDSSYSRNDLFKFEDELCNYLGIENLIQNYTLYCANDKNQTSVANKGNLIEQPPWNGEINVFEQRNNDRIYLNKLNSLFFLKRLIGEKNVHNAAMNRKKCSDSSFMPGLLKNSYGLSGINLDLESNEVLEIVRHKLENSDKNRIIHLSTEVDSIFSNISNEILEFLDEEAPHAYKPSLSLLMNEDSITKTNNFNLIKISNFANTRFLLDQSNFCNDIWLMDLKYIESLGNGNLNSNFNPLAALAFAVYQTSITVGDVNSIYANPLSILGRAVNHPFRNIAIFDQSKANNIRDNTSFFVDENFESLCSKYFLDICQSEYFGLELLDKSEVISIINENPCILGKEAEQIIDYLNKNTHKVIPNYSNSTTNNMFPISILHTIYSIKNCKLINSLFKSILGCKSDSKFLNMTRDYYNLELVEINEIFESVSTLLDT
ncbi:exportin 1 [Cryptosporidium tyzzeri]|nr:exportin 1 [Cryptosporidium tyzzeri]